MKTPESKFISTIQKFDNVSSKDIDVTVFECKTPGKVHNLAITGECGKALYVAENGFLRKFTHKTNGRWKCEILAELTFN